MKTTGMITINKWHFKLGFIPYAMAGLYIYMFHFGIFKLISWPPEGEIITKENYKGFWFRKTINLADGFEISHIFKNK